MMTQAVENPALFPGLNIKEGLERFAGNQQIYNEILQTFASDHQNIVSLIKMHIQTQNWVEAKKLTHSLKGTSGNISMSRVHNAAKNLDLAIKEARYQQANDYLPELESAFTEALQSIEKLAKADANAEQQTCVDIDINDEKIQSLLQQLKEQMEEQNVEALEIFRQLYEDFKQSQYAESFESIKKHLNRFDFDAALAVLKQL